MWIQDHLHTQSMKAVTMTSPSLCADWTRRYLLVSCGQLENPAAWQTSGSPLWLGHDPCLISKQAPNLALTPYQAPTVLLVPVHCPHLGPVQVLIERRGLRQVAAACVRVKESCQLDPDLHAQVTNLAVHASAV